MTPAFLVIGDTKAGSSSLHHYLGQHPEIFVPPEKELRYFAYDPQNSYHRRASSTRVRTLDDYLAHFDRAPGAAVIGEVSPNYLRSPGAAARIRSTLPDVKLIVSLRNPADRLYSLHMMHLRDRTTNVPFDQRAFADDAAWIKGNFYWPELDRYFARFPRARIKVILFEDLAANPLEVTQSLYRFLGVDDGFVPEIRVYNEGGVPRHPLLYTAMTECKQAVKRVMHPPERARAAWRRLRRRALRRPPFDPKLRRQILEVCRDDVLRTQALIRRDLGRWLSEEPAAASAHANESKPSAALR